jgi:anthranilate phosphoribosyltransferase
VTADYLQGGSQECRAGQSLDPLWIPGIVEELLSTAIADETKANFLKALTDKGETAGELAGFALAFLPLAKDPGLLGEWRGKVLFDCCGTGGGGLNIFNVSTAIMFVLAALEVPVVKHGNRGITKKSGSADVLESMGLQIELTPDQLSACLEAVGCAFVYAPAFHPAFKAIAPIRRALAAEGRRTIFNLLGPLLNPVRPGGQMVGVFKEAQLTLFAQALAQMGRQKYSVVCGCDAEGHALGESVFGSRNTVVMNGMIPQQITMGEDELGAAQEIAVGSAEESAQLIEAIFQGKVKGAARRMIEVNVAMALLTLGRVEKPGEGMALASETIELGYALDVLRKWREFSRSLER